jgi:hypothetical protein
VNARIIQDGRLGSPGEPVKKGLLALAATLAVLFTAHGAFATIIVSVLSKDGMVLVADKRTRTPDGRGISDEGNKIHVTQDGKTAWITAGDVTRLASRVADGGVETYFDADQTISRQMRAGADPMTSFEPIGDALRTDLLSGLAQLSRNGSPPPDRFLLKSVFFVVHGGEQGAASMNLLYDGGTDVRVTPFDEPDCVNRTLCYFGNVSVAEQLRYYDDPTKCSSCNDPRFADLRAEASLSTFLHGNPPWPTVPIEDAVAVAKRLVAVTNERSALVGQHRNDVGPTVDIAVLRRDGEFSWVDRDVLANPHGSRRLPSTGAPPPPPPSPILPWILVGACGVGLASLGFYVRKQRVRASARPPSGRKPGGHERA